MGRICMKCGELLHKDATTCKYCSDGGIVEELASTATFGDYFVICKISKNPIFIKTMMELHDTNIIEYEIKMSQFRNQTNQIESEQKQVKCPKCGSTSISTGARGLNFTFGIIGASKTVNRCASCGYTWKP